MGVGVGDIGRAMGGPTGMADAGLARQGFMHQQVAEIDQFSDRTAAIKLPVVDGGDPGAVIAAVFQSFQRLNQRRRGLVMA